MKEELIISGYTFKEILAMQQRKFVHTPIKFEPKPKANQQDKNLLELHGLEKLKSMQFDGVLARLRESSLID
jgi:hypothetical protein